MYREIEIVTLLLAAGVLVLMTANRRTMTRMPSPGFLLAAPCLVTIGCAASVIEGFWLRPLFNLLEHACFAAGAILAATWVWRSCRSSGEAAR